MLIIVVVPVNEDVPAMVGARAMMTVRTRLQSATWLLDGTIQDWCKALDYARGLGGRAFAVERYTSVEGAHAMVKGYAALPIRTPLVRPSRARKVAS